MKKYERKLKRILATCSFLSIAVTMLLSNVVFVSGKASSIISVRAELSKTANPTRLDFAAGNQIDPCTQAAPIAFGQTIGSSLANTDCSVGGRFRDRYSFNGNAGQLISINLSSRDFDTYLYLLNSSGQTIAQNDNYSSASRGASGIPASGGGEGFTLPYTGSYIIVVSSNNSGETGALISFL